MRLSPGDTITYDFTVNPQLQGNQTNDPYVCQRWTSIKVCADAKAPFDRAPRQSDFTAVGGNLADWTLVNSTPDTDGCYEIQIGKQMRPGQDPSPKNRNRGLAGGN